MKHLVLFKLEVFFISTKMQLRNCSSERTDDRHTAAKAAANTRSVNEIVRGQQHDTHSELFDCSRYFSLFAVQQVNILCSPRTLTRLRCFIAVLFWKSRNMSPTARVKCSGTKRRRRSSVTARKTLLSSLFSSLLPRFSSLVAPSFVYSWLSYPSLSLSHSLFLCSLATSLVPFVFPYAPPHTAHHLLNPFRYISNWCNELAPNYRTINYRTLQSSHQSFCRSQK